MARNNQRGGTTSRRAPKDLGRRVKKKPCALCRDKTEWVDYKDVPMLRKYMSDRGKIRSRRVTGNCAQHQRALAQAIKTARELVLLPYTQRTVTERPGGRRGDRERSLSETTPAPPARTSASSDDATSAAEDGGDTETDSAATGSAEGDDGAAGTVDDEAATEPDVVAEAGASVGGGGGED